MKKLIVAVASIVLSLSVQAASVSVEFVKKEQYQDIESGSNQSQPRFEERLFNVIKSSFEKNSEKLANDLVLKVSVLDIDLAGTVAHGLGMGKNIRHVSDRDFPRMLFYMILEDKNGNIVFQGRQNLKEKRISHKDFRMKGSQSDFFLETALVSKWFDGVLVPAVARL